MRRLTLILAVMTSLCVAAVPARAQQAQLSDAEYIAQAVSAAPPAIAEGAAVVRLGNDGRMRTLRPGDNGFTCLITGTAKRCNDRNAMEFMQALAKHVPPPNKVGISFMLGGMATSNTDPYATHKTADNHWIVTGPHIMILGPASKALGYTTAKDPDPNKPYMMWPGTPYEHAMIPFAPPK